MNLEKKSQIIITIDTDWTPYACIQDTLGLLKNYGVQATFSATRDADFDWFAGHDLAIHPNFTEGTQNEDAIVKEIDACLKCFPQAKGIRAHALVNSTRHYLLLRDKYPRLSYTSNYYMPDLDGLKPFITQSEKPELPIYWMDHLHLEAHDEVQIDDLIHSAKKPGLKVYDFHPYHIMINSMNVEHFTKAKADYHDDEKLLSHRSKGAGVREFFTSLLSEIRDGKLQACTMFEYVS